MKKTIKLFGLASIAAIILFSLAACGGGDPGSHPDAERWTKFVDPGSTATIDYSVDADGVCKITVGGIAMPNQSGNYQAWRASAQYKYTVKANTHYRYTFEAWTEKGSGDRPVNIEYYSTGPNDWLQLYDNFTEERKTYSYIGEIIPMNSEQSLSFQCAHKLGTFYVKMISITEYTPQLEYELIDDHYEDGDSNPNNGTYRVKSAVGMRGAVEIPASYNGIEVTEISWDAFRDLKNLTSITIPASVNYIGPGTFFDCTSLTSITVDNDNNDYSSEGGILYNKDKSIIHAYPSASGEYSIPNNVTVIGDSAFETCTGLTGVIIHENVTSIGSWAFGGCTGIDDITIPATVEWVGYLAFDRWTSSQTITIEGHADRDSTISADWPEEWDENCDAKIEYEP